MIHENNNISDSILSSVKKMIGIPEEESSFDLDVMLNINAAISTLFQLGVIEHPYTITSNNDMYSDLFPNGTEDVINQVKMYFVYKTKLGFDSSTLTASVIQVLKDLISETEYRLMISFNPDNTFE